MKEIIELDHMSNRTYDFDYDFFKKKLEQYDISSLRKFRFFFMIAREKSKYVLDKYVSLIWAESLYTGKTKKISATTILVLSQLFKTKPIQLMKNIKPSQYKVLIKK